MAADYLQLLRQWATHHRYRNAGTIYYLPADTSTPLPAGWRAVKRHGNVAASWPTPPVTI